MKKISIMSLILGALMVINAICITSVVALEETKAEGIVLFETDFESDVPGDNPTSISYTGTSADSTVCASGSNDNTTQHVLFQRRLRALFDSNAKNSGILYVNFDAMATGGYLSVSLLYSDSTTTYGKWIFGMPTTSNDGFFTWQMLNGVPPISPTATFKKKGTTEIIPFAANTWNNYRLKIDIDNSTVTLFVDGIESETITGYEYFDSTTLIGGVGFRNEIFNPNNNAYIDNIKIHWEETETYYKTIFSEDFENGTSKWYEAGTTNVVANDTSDIGGTVTKGTAISTYIETTEEPSDPDNMVFLLNSSKGTGKTVYTTFSENVSDNLCIEAEFQGGSACLGIGLLEEGNLDDTKYIFYVPSANRAFSYSIDGRLINGTIGYNEKYLIEGSTYGLMIDRSQWHTLKLLINLTEGTVKPIINGREMQKATIPYIQGKTICGIELANNRDLTSAGIELDHIKYFDNIKVYTTSDGMSVSDIKTGSNKVKVTFKDVINAATLTTDNIEIVDTTGATKGISSIEAISSTQALIILTDALTDATDYVIRLSDGIEYADGNAILPYVNTFTYEKGSFTAEVVIDEVNQTQESVEASATCTVNAFDLSNRDVQLILAAYEGSKLVGVKLQDYQYDGSNYEQDINSINESFDAAVDTVKVFVWDGNLVPYNENGIWEASN